ncbi:hypothetical protein EDC04DRAFT_3140844 [Pisolithus marmoratus]|nr:hypothetical protein EDC04DRAFT_3140844 [Pisolithus marmoratus]
MAKHLGLDEDGREWISQGHVPVFAVEKDVNGDIAGICMGRSKLPARATNARAFFHVSRLQYLSIERYHSFDRFLRELTARFVDLIGVTSSRKRSVKFEESVWAIMQEGKWRG